MSKLLILDFGSQYTQLIARRARELGIYAEIKPYNADITFIKDYAASAIILSGGPASTLGIEPPQPDYEIYNLNVPIMGICYGHQITSRHFGGTTEPSDKREFGRATLNIDKNNKLFSGIEQDSFDVWMSHGDHVSKIPDGFKVCATTSNAPYAAIYNEEKQLYCVQFHPEVSHSQNGAEILGNFLFNIAGLKPDWNMANFKDSIIDKVKSQVGDNQVLCAVSGGVDSTVVAKLLHEAIGEQLTCVFVDTGCLRKDEAKQVQHSFRDVLGIDLIAVDASEKFISELAGVSDPEKKRKIIGAGFIDVFEQEAKKLQSSKGEFKFLAQGTLYPDVIESVSFTGGPSVTIKSHHNVGGLPARMRMDLVEPLRELFKDEVRKLGIELGIAPEMVYRHPFPGPGLAIRIPGAIDQEKLDILKEADSIFIQELISNNIYGEIWQAFAGLLPVRTVGVMGDGRTYEYICLIRAVTSTDGMTADFYHFTPEFIGKLSSRIVNEVKGINRVVYDVTSKPPGTIELE